MGSAASTMSADPRALHPDGANGLASQISVDNQLAAGDTSSSATIGGHTSGLPPRPRPTVITDSAPRDVAALRAAALSTARAKKLAVDSESSDSPSSRGGADSDGNKSPTDDKEDGEISEEEDGEIPSQPPQRPPMRPPTLKKLEVPTTPTLAAMSPIIRSTVVTVRDNEGTIHSSPLPTPSEFSS